MGVGRAGGEPRRREDFEFLLGMLHFCVSEHILL